MPDETPLTPTANGVRLAVRLTPRAAKNRFGPVEASADGKQRLQAYVTAVPEDGTANKALIKLLARALKIPAGKSSVASGATNRKKQRWCEGAPETLAHRMDQWIKDITP